MKSFAIPLLFLALFQAAGCDYFVSAETRVERAREHIQKGDHRSAAVELRNALKERPDLAAARLLLADVALWLGDVEGAEEQLLRATPEVDPKTYADLQTRVDLALGRQQRVLNRLDAGEVSLDPVTQDYYRGTALLESRQPQAAADVFRSVVQRDPKNVAAKAALAEALAAQNNLDEALRVTEEAVQAHPDQALAWFVRGAMLMNRRDLPAAAEALQKATELAPRQLDVPKRASLLSALIDVRLLSGDVEAARSASGMLDRVLPGSQAAVLMSSRVAIAANDFTTATSQLQRLVNGAPDALAARFLLAVSLIAQGNLEQASSELTQVVQKAPGHLEARELLARVRLQLQDPDGAMRALVPALQAGAEDNDMMSLFDVAQFQKGGEQSIPLLERALADKPESAALQSQLAVAYLRAGSPEKARAVLNRKSDAPADSRRIALLLESISRSEGLPAASAEAERLVSAQPSDLRTRLDVAKFYVRNRQVAKATAHLESARQQSESAVEPRLLLAQLALAANDAKRTDELVGEALKASAEYPGLRNTVGQLYMRAGRFDRASEHFRAGVDAEPGNAVGWLNLGRAQAALGQPAPARQALEKALELRPNWVAAEGALVFMDLQSGARDSALKRVAALKASAPKDPNVHALEGETNLALREYAQAAAAFEAAYKLQPSAPFVSKVVQARMAGKLPAPTELLQSWLRDNPNDLTSRQVLADAHLRAGEPSQAMEQYNRILARQPANVTALNNLAWLHYEQKDFPKALDLARRAVAAAPRSPAVNDTLGWILVESGQVREGLPILKAAAEAPDTMADIRYHYAAGLARAGSNEEARTRLQRLLEEEQAFSSREAAEQLLRQLTSATNGEGRG